VAFTLRHNEQLEATLPDTQKQVKLLQSLAESNVNMSRVYFIVSDESASASEMVIVGMRGLDVDATVVGLTTEGKNVGMEVITKYIDGYNYEFSPVTFQIFNAKNESNYSAGIRADYEVDEWEDLRSDGWKPLGDPEEVMLNMALNLITGNATRGSVGVSPTPQKSGSIKHLKYTDPKALRGALIVAEECEE
jgi:C-terminal processing protease CtpA/Prc